MKTERRHDLETNDLAVRLKALIEQLRPYATLLLGGAVIFVGLFALASAWRSFNASQEQAAWDAYALAALSNDPELMELRRLAEDEQYLGTAMQEWAYLTWSDRQVQLASQSYFVDRDSTQDRLRQVLGIYGELADSASDAQIRNRARFGLGQVYEMQNKLDEARREYGLVRGDLQPLAQERIEELSEEKAEDVYSWLATAELPEPPAREAEAAATPARPDFEAELPAAAPNPNALLDDSRSLEDILLGEDEEQVTVEEEVDQAMPEGGQEEQALTNGDAAAPIADETPAESDDDSANP